MDNKIASYGLVSVSVLLALGLYLRHDSATQAQKTASEREEKLLGALKVLEAQGTALRGEADLVIERLKAKSGEASTLSNRVETLTTVVAQTKQSLTQATAGIETVKASVVAAQNETRAVEARALAERAQLEKALADYQRAVKDRDAALASAAQANESLVKQAEQLTAEIKKQEAVLKGLNSQIAGKEKELLNTRGERDLLTQELKTLMVKRDELERQLHDLSFLKEQVAYLKAEQATARRFAASRAGKLPDDTKGATRLLMTHSPKLTPAATNSPPSLNPSPLLIVELERDGTVSLVPAPFSKKE